jgi:5'-nucleotidase
MLGAGHEVFLCTSPLTGSRWCVPEKLAWVEQHLGPRWLRRTIITADKTLVGDRLQRCILVDDRPVIKGLADPPPWQHVLFDAPYNRTKPGPRLSSWADWREILGPYLDGH